MNWPDVDHVNVIHFLLLPGCPHPHTMPPPFLYPPLPLFFSPQRTWRFEFYFSTFIYPHIRSKGYPVSPFTSWVVWCIRSDWKVVKYTIKFFYLILIESYVQQVPFLRKVVSRTSWHYISLLFLSVFVLLGAIHFPKNSFSFKKTSQISKARCLHFVHDHRPYHSAIKANFCTLGKVFLPT